jgi:hypothetical protein
LLQETAHQWVFAISDAKHPMTCSPRRNQTAATGNITGIECSAATGAAPAGWGAEPLSLCAASADQSIAVLRLTAQHIFTK